MKLASFEGLDKVKPDVALEAVHKALIRLYELNGMDVAEPKVSHKVLESADNIQRGAPKAKKGTPTSVSNRKLKLTSSAKQLPKSTQAARLASSILLDIQSAEGRPIQTLSRGKLSQYTGVLSGLVQKKIQVGSVTDLASVEQVREKLKAVKY